MENLTTTNTNRTEGRALRKSNKNNKNYNNNNFNKNNYNIKQDNIYKIDSIEKRPSAHASTICAGPIIDGNQYVFSAWFCGIKEGHVDVAIMFSTLKYYVNKDSSFSKGMQDENVESFNWSKPEVVADIKEKALGNPVLFYDKNGALHLWFVAFLPIRKRDNKREIYHQVSYDLGKTWSAPTLFSDRNGLWVRNSLLVLSNDDWLLPINDEVTFNKNTKTYWSSRFVLSHDEGKSWFFSQLYSIRGGMIQPTVIEFFDKRLYCLNRARKGKIVEMWSYDLGKTWTKPKKMQLNNPNSGICMLYSKYLDPKTIFLVYNPTKRRRTPLNIAISKDHAKSWQDISILVDIPGEYSYPAICETSDGIIHITYTYDRKTIRYARISRVLP